MFRFRQRALRSCDVIHGAGGRLLALLLLLYQLQCSLTCVGFLALSEFRADRRHHARVNQSAARPRAFDRRIGGRGRGVLRAPPIMMTHAGRYAEGLLPARDLAWYWNRILSDPSPS